MGRNHNVKCPTCNQRPPDHKEGCLSACPRCHKTVHPHYGGLFCDCGFAEHEFGDYTIPVNPRDAAYFEQGCRYVIECPSNPTGRQTLYAKTLRAANRPKGRTFGLFFRRDGAVARMWTDGDEALAAVLCVGGSAAARGFVPADYSKLGPLLARGLPRN